MNNYLDSTIMYQKLYCRPKDEKGIFCFKESTVIKF